MKITECIGQISGVIAACEMYKDIDAKNDAERMKAESVSYNTIKETIEEFKRSVKEGSVL